jgi:MSHA pilin protein MshC
MINSHAIRSKKLALSLVELVMVMVIIGILAVVAIPRVEVFYNIKFHAAAKKLVSDIRYAQNIAISKHVNITVAFTPASDSYSVIYTANSTSLRDPFTHSSMVTDYRTDAQYAGIDILANVSFGGTPSLRFDWQGIPEDANGNNITVTGNVVLRYHDFDDITISVTPQTARITAR